MRLTHIGGPTVLVELAGWRILTDPTFDPPGRKYGFGWGTSSVKTAGPAVDPADLGGIDVVLLSHDHHADNLDDAGRLVLARVAFPRTGSRSAPRAGGVRGQGHGALGDAGCQRRGVRKSSSTRDTSSGRSSVSQ